MEEEKFGSCLTARLLLSARMTKKTSLEAVQDCIAKYEVALDMDPFVIV